MIKLSYLRADFIFNLALPTLPGTFSRAMLKAPVTAESWMTAEILRSSSDFGEAVC